MSLSICPWKYGKRWVYSITYDEALTNLHRFAIPMHEEYRIPGHVEVVVGQLGEIRNIGNSSFNGFRHMNAGELRDLLARGWGVGNHSWSHEIITPETVDREIGHARQVLEEALREAIILYCSPGDNTNMADHVLEACRRFNYLGAMSLTDALNLPGDELFWINRTALHDHYYPPFYSVFDPYRNIRQAQELQGWLIDYCHCPLETAVHPNKDCSEAQLRQRLETVLSEGGDDVWCAVPEEALSYHLMRRHARIEMVGGDRALGDGGAVGDASLGNETVCDKPESQRYRIALPELPVQVPYRSLTVEVGVPAAWCRDPRVTVDGQEQSAEVLRPGVLRVTTLVKDGTEVEVRESPRP
ncbi:MAG: polysaccharide deacetylase family protein [Gemmatimonadetes bacterium]|nr:polysaccharide deacetylase family protein [Gemmatimonadota bacterium]